VPQVAGAELFSYQLRQACRRVGLADVLPVCDRQPFRDRVQRLGLARDASSVVGLRGSVWLLGADEPLPACDLVVHPETGEVSRGLERLTLSGQAIELLLQLSDGSAQKSVEELYLTVWRASSYHPLRHRNTVYVAINRLRGGVERLLGRELLQRHGEAGYSLMPNVAVAVSSSVGAPAPSTWATARWHACREPRR